MASSSSNNRPVQQSPEGPAEQTLSATATATGTATATAPKPASSRKNSNPGPARNTVPAGAQQLSSQEPAPTTTTTTGISTTSATTSPTAGSSSNAPTTSTALATPSSSTSTLRTPTSVVSPRRSRDPSPTARLQRIGSAADQSSSVKPARATDATHRQASSPSRLPVFTSTASIGSAAGPVTADAARSDKRANASPAQEQVGGPRRSPGDLNRVPSNSALSQDPPTTSASKLSSTTTPSTAPAPSASDTSHARPRWPVPPRLKSPPPGPASSSSKPPISYSRQSSSSSVKKSEGEEQVQSSLNTRSLIPDDEKTQSEHSNTIQSASKGATAAQSAVTAIPAGGSTAAAAPTGGAIKIPRGFSGVPPKLETVEEGDQNTPPSSDGHKHSVNTNTATTNPDAEKSKENITTADSGKMGQEYASDRERQASVSERPRVQSAGPAPASRKQLLVSTSPDKTNTDGASSNRMVAETETVASIPQAVAAAAALAGSSSDRTAVLKKDESGTIRVKAGSESSRSRKDRKKAARKPASIISGIGSTKADLFEAKVNSAVDEDTSDSDETFVYESNPMELKPRTTLHHSRTPSVTSMQSVGDRRGGMRGIDGVLTNNVGVKGKRSMKFASSSYASSGVESESEMPMIKQPSAHHRHDRQNQHHHHHHHHHQHGRHHNHLTTSDAHRGNHGRLASEQDSPFSQAATRMREANQGDSPSSRTPSKARLSRYSSAADLQSPTKKAEYSSPYQSGGENAADEQTPLMGTVRTHRTHHRRPQISHLRNIEYEEEPTRRRRWPASCCGFLIVLMILLLIGCGAGLVVGTTKPLKGVKILKIQNLIASEQELMLDLLVEAINPNIVTIAVSEMDVNIFAKSSHIKDTTNLHHHQLEPQYKLFQKKTHRSLHRRPSHTVDDNAGHQHYPPREGHALDGVDEGNDPIDGDKETMLLGRIFHFDSALTFEPTPIQRELQVSMGEVRLPRPGNKTETGGSQRWERVLKYDYELIVRGFVKYQLPLSSRYLTASVGGQLKVHPDKDDKDDSDHDKDGDHGKDGKIKSGGEVLTS